MNRHCLLICFISGVIYNTCALSIDCGDFYDDDTISKTWGYVYYSCNGTVVANESNSRVMELFGLHLHGRNSSYTERFILNYQNLSSFPTNFNRSFPYLRIIDFSNNCIDSVSNHQLQPHKRLNSLILDYNKIATLESNLFDGLDQLIEVKLNDNAIKHVGYDIKLPQNVYMNNNPCTPTCCKYMDMNTTVLEHLRNQCRPLLQSTIEQSVDRSHDINTVSSNIVDRTQEKDEEPATEEPSIDIKPPRLGEFIHCSIAVMHRPDEPLGKRCTEIINHLNSMHKFEPTMNPTAINIA